MVLETTVFHAAGGKDLVILQCILHCFWLIHPCDAQTDRRTDGQNCDGYKTRWKLSRVKMSCDGKQRSDPSLIWCC